MRSSAMRAVLVSIAGLALAAPAAMAQTAPLQSFDAPWPLDSGPLAAAEPRQVVFQTRVTVPNAAWLRLQFANTQLSGVIEEGSGAFLRITSLKDNAVQYLDAVSLGQWANTSAYFNGDSVLIELVAFPGTPASRVGLRAVTFGPAEAMQADSICDGSDNRTLSSDPRSARHMPIGCTSWLINDTNHMFMTAGHCGTGSGDVMQFNVPLSSSGGGTIAPPPEHQYTVDATSSRSVNGGVGNDYSYFGTFVNSNTGLTAHQAQGQHHVLAVTLPAAANQVTRVTGYGTTSSPVSPTWSQVQKTHTGPRVTTTGSTTLAYRMDTTGGNSGSAVEDETTGLAIGIHTHGGCTSSGGSNKGTMITHTGITGYLNTPLGICKTGVGTPGGDLFAVGDAANNFGTLNTATGNFARVGDGPARVEGAAYNPVLDVFYISTNDTFANVRKLYSVSASGGVASTFIADLSGTTAVINGLAFDAGSQTLYGIAQATGALYTIDTGTGAATLVGGSGGTIGALDFDGTTGTLYGIDDSAGASKLVSIDPATGAQTLIGTLGAGIADCNGLAAMADGSLYTINAATDQLLSINKATGAATVVGATGGLFAASYGMAALVPNPTPACYANCDGSTAAPALNVADFTCFLNRFAAGESYANCDQSTSPPVLNVADFTCFLNAFASGCP